MDLFLSRYRNLTVLLIAIVAQLLLIAYQVKSNKDVSLIRVWAVTAVTPVEQGLEFVRRYTWGFVEDYFVLLHVRGENEKLKRDNGQLKMENHYLKAELSTADRAQALSVFQAHSPSKTVAARVIGNGTGANSKTVFIDRGSTSGIERGMAVVTPEGIVGKVVDAYPMSSLVMVMTDPTFASGVISEKNRVRGTLKGQGDNEILVDHVQNEEKVEVGEMFYSSGDDRIFPRGFPVGQVRVVRNGKTFKEIYIAPSGFQGSVEAVLVVLQGVHQAIPDHEVAASTEYKILSPPVENPTDTPKVAGQPPLLSTDADRLREQYKQSGEAQKHVFGEVGSKAPDFSKIQGIRAATPAPPPGQKAPDRDAVKDALVKPPPVPAKPPEPAPAVAAAPAPVKVSRPKPTGPLLVTDPTDADPGSEAIPFKADKPPASKQPAQKPPGLPE